MGGPNWPEGSTPAESKQACASSCDNRSDCAYYIWWNDRGCRTQTSCEQAVEGFSHSISYICKKGKYFLYALYIDLSICFHCTIILLVKLCIFYYYFFANRCQQKIKGKTRLWNGILKREHGSIYYPVLKSTF